MNSDKLQAAINGLERIHDRVLKVEVATRRARTPGRENQIIGDHVDDLSGWDSHQTEAAAAIGVDLWQISNHAYEYVDAMIKKWT